MPYTKTVLKETASGPIEASFDGVMVRLEFNCNCLDAVEICRGMCCRQRVGFSVELERDELEKFQHRPHPTREGVFLVAATEDGLNCCYLVEPGLCSVHRDKPRMCRKWHCSPGGEPEDRDLERRDAGWMLYPIRKEEAELIQIQLKEQP
jgi:Fe-S-cluster containining protein